MRGIFVTGTDTNVGKTVISAALMLRYRKEALLRYWKPIQTGIRDSHLRSPSFGGQAGFGIRISDCDGSSADDTVEVARLSHASEGEILRCGLRLPDPLSPHLAAQRAGIRITVRELTAMVSEVDHASDSESRVPNPESRPRWIVEGAGGALVPINERETMVDLMRALDLPVLIAARSTLGTINHTLMTVETFRRRMLRVAGVVMVGEPNDENRLAIEKYGGAEVIAQMPRFDPLTPEALEHWVRTEFDRRGVLFVGGLR
jgi:dethiobiotin synthetase